MNNPVRAKRKHLRLVLRTAGQLLSKDGFTACGLALERNWGQRQSRRNRPHAVLNLSAVTCPECAVISDDLLIAGAGEVTRVAKVPFNGCPALFVAELQQLTRDPRSLRWNKPRTGKVKP